jgi:hypothetical protein
MGTKILYKVLGVTSPQASLDHALMLLLLLLLLLLLYCEKTVRGRYWSIHEIEPLTIAGH